MTSKEALDRFMKTLCEYESDTNNKESNLFFIYISPLF